MDLLQDNNGLITGYTTVGKIEGGQLFQGDLPQDFDTSFEPDRYVLDGQVIKANPDKNVDTASKPMPSTVMAAINALGIQVAQLTAKVEAQAGGAN